MPKLEEIDALKIGVKNSIKQENYPRVLERLDKLRRLYLKIGTPDSETFIKKIDTLLEAVKGYSRSTRPGREDYIHGAEGAVGVSREEEIQELQRAACIPTRLELDEKASDYFRIIEGSDFMLLEDVCWIDGKAESQVTGFNHNIEGSSVHLCGKHAADYQAVWRPEHSPTKPDVLKYAREKSPELFELLMANSS